MTQRTKLLLGAAAAVGLVLFLRRKSSAASGSAFFTELNMVDCNCFSVEFFRDGTTRSTKVPLTRCMADETGLADKAKQCRDAEDAILKNLFDAQFDALLSGASDAVSSLFSGPNPTDRNPGQAV